MSNSVNVRYEIRNELARDNKKKPPIASYEEFDEEPYLDENENDGEMIPLNKRFDYPERNGNENDEVDGIDRGLVPAGYFPQPNYYPEPAPVDIPSFNLYQQKKSLAQGMLDLALLSANANQLRYVLDINVRNHYYYVSLSLISTSLILQVLVAIALIFKSRYNVDQAEGYENADRVNNFILIGILLITISNVVSSAFAPSPINV